MSVDQTHFTAALLNPTVPVPEGLRDFGDRPAGRRFNVYRNNVAVSLTEAMHTGFPIITKLLGPQNMDGLAGMFLRAHPPSSPLMMHYGEAFPEFLTGIEQLSHLGYLADVARLELAIRDSYHAADSPAIDPAILGDLAPEDLLAATLTLASSLRLLCSDWPLYDLWRFNTQDGADQPRSEAQSVLIVRAEFDPEPHLLDSGSAAWIKAICAGETIGDALESANAADPEFDLGPLLTLLLQNHAISSLHKKDQDP